RNQVVILEALSLLPGRHRGILHGTFGHGFRAGRGAVPGCCGGHSRHRGQDPALWRSRGRLAEYDVRHSLFGRCAAPEHRHFRPVPGKDVPGDEKTSCLSGAGDGGGRAVKGFWQLFDRKLWKFLLVGVVNTLVGSAIMFGLYNLAGWGYWVSSAMNYLLTSILSFFLNKYFTFQSR